MEPEVSHSGSFQSLRLGISDIASEFVNLMLRASAGRNVTSKLLRTLTSTYFLSGNHMSKTKTTPDRELLFPATIFLESPTVGATGILDIFKMTLKTRS
ncbi:hypothetical protein JTB14_022088 [Gonioctena quinquepunctata]|nr:hypothetical protein JTB14_022088 [Gonioctena quinquepunctata]